MQCVSKKKRKTNQPKKTETNHPVMSVSNVSGQPKVPSSSQSIPLSIQNFSQKYAKASSVDESTPLVYSQGIQSTVHHCHNNKPLFKVSDASGSNLLFLDVVIRPNGSAHWKKKKDFSEKLMSRKKHTHLSHQSTNIFVFSSPLCSLEFIN